MNLSEKVLPLSHYSPFLCGFYPVVFFQKVLSSQLWDRSQNIKFNLYKLHLIVQLLVSQQRRPFIHSPAKENKRDTRIAVGDTNIMESRLSLKDCMLALGNDRKHGQILCR